MRIHRLEISAFGPFAATEHIDFDRLSAHGLFLLNGPTGAGKTSVLDAICFALYGSVPGARQDGKRLRSDHAEAAAEPRVTCEFSARGRHFEVSRSPAWDKPSARGKNGFTVQQANTLLRERVDGEWIEKSGRNDEAGAEIADVLGMNREQFTRVVMLPQGDFAAFLRSKATDRLELLQSLFGTQRFEAVEQELGRKAQAARTEVASLNGQLELLLAQAEAETAALELDTADAPDRANPDSFLDWLEASAAAAAERAPGGRGSRPSGCGPNTLPGRTPRQPAPPARPSWPPPNCAAPSAEAAAPASAAKAEQLGLHRKAEVLGGQLQAMDSAEAAEDLAAAAMAAAAEELRAAALTDPELAALAEHGRGRQPDQRNGPRAAGVDGSPALDGEACGPRWRTAVPPRGARGTAAGRGQARRAAEPAAPSSGWAWGSWKTGRTAAGCGPGRAARMNRRHCSPRCVRSRNSPPKSRLRTKEAAAAEELLVLVAALRRCRDGPRSRCGTPQPAPGRSTRTGASAGSTSARNGWPTPRPSSLPSCRPASRARSAAAPSIPPPPRPPRPPWPSPKPNRPRRTPARRRRAALAALERELSDAQQEVAVLAAQGGDTAPEDARLEAALARERAAEAHPCSGRNSPSTGRGSPNWTRRSPPPNQAQAADGFQHRPDGVHPR